MAEAPIAWLPMGAIEFHAEHLPLGTDGFSAQHVVERAARLAGGVVLPWSAVTLGTLHLPWSLRYEATLVEAVLRQTLLGVAAHGARVAVVHTGHGPLDLDHLIKRVCVEVEASDRVPEGFRAYGLCYLELNVALGTGLGTDWPVAIDHGSIVETSWVMAMEPDLVALERLPEPDAGDPIVGVYGPNPRGRASRAMGEAQLEACAGLLAERARRLLAGERIDAFADLREFVRRYWPEPLELSGRAGSPGEAALLVRNPAPVSRYLTGLALELDGTPVGPAGVMLRNPTPGEAGVPVPADALAPESGFYVRRAQAAEASLPVAVEPGRHRVTARLGLAGVTEQRLDTVVAFG
jgi:creatinine amidohydrolase